MSTVLVLFLALSVGFLVFVRWHSRRKVIDTHAPAWFNASNKCQIAVHESGHAVVAWCCTIVTRIAQAVVGSDGGFVDYAIQPFDSSDVRWCKIVLCMAGAAAEITVFGKIRSGESRSDLAEARSLTEGLIGKGDSTSPWRIKWVGPKSLPFAQIYVPTISPEEETILANAYVRAKELVQAHGDRFYALVTELMEKRILDEQDLERILHKRSFVQLVGMMRPTFISPNGGRRAA